MPGSVSPTSTSLGGAQFTVGLDSTNLEQGLASLKSTVEQQSQTIQQQLSQQQNSFTQAHTAMRGAVDQTGFSIKEFARGLEEGAISLAKITTGLTVATTASEAFRQFAEVLVQASEASRSLGEEVTKLETITGASAEQASQQIAVWARFGISAGDAERSFTTLSRAISNFNSGTGGAGGGAGAKILDDLNISLKDLSGNALPLTTVMAEIFDGLNKIADPATRDYDATVLLGRSWQDSARLIKEGSAGLKELEASMGSQALMSQEQVDKNEKWTLAITGMTAAFKGLSLTLGDILSGPMTRLATDVGNLVKGWNDNKDGVQGWKNALDTLVTGLEGAGGAIGAILGPIGQFLTGIRDATTQTGAFFKMLQDNKNATGPFAGLTQPSTTSFGHYSTPGYTGPGSPGYVDPNAPRVPVGGQYNLGQGTPAGGGLPTLPNGQPTGAGWGNAFGFDTGFPSDQQLPYAGGGGGPVGGYAVAPASTVYGQPKAGQPGFTYSPGPPPAAPEAAPRVPLPEVPIPGAPGDQVAQLAQYQKDVEAATGAATEKKKLIADFYTAQKDADADLIKQHDAMLKEYETASREENKIELDLLDTKLAAAKFEETQLTAANDATHKSAIAGITAEKQASDAAAAQAIKDAQAKRDLETRGAGDAHDAALAQIATDTEVAKTASTAQREQYIIDKDARTAANTQAHDAALAGVADEIEKTKVLRSSADKQLQEANIATDEANKAIHQGVLDRIHEESTAKLDAIKEAQKADTEAAAAANRAISDVGFAYNQQHQDRLRAIQDETRALAAQHQANLDGIADQQKAATDAHTADLKAIADQTKALDNQHAKALQAIADQSAADTAARTAALEALNVATKAQTDALSATTKSQTDAIDDQVAALTVASAAIAAAKLDTQQQGALSASEAKLANDQNQAKIQAANTNPATATPANLSVTPASIIADAQAVDNAEAAIAATAAQRKDAEQKAALAAQKQALVDQSAAQLKAIQDQAAVQQKAIEDQAERELQLRATQTRALNDQLAQAKSTLAQETEAQNTAFATRMSELAAETDAENRRFAGLQAKLQSDTEAENVAAAAFAESQRKKAQAVQDALKAQTDALAVQSANETKTTAAAVKSETDRYTTETNDIRTTRKVAADELATQRAAEDAAFANNIEKANAAYKNEQDAIKATYDTPPNGLFPQLAKSEKETTDKLAARKKSADETYKAEQDRIKETYDGPREDGGLAIIPAIERAKTDADKAFSDRTLAANNAYESEKARIHETYQNTDPDHLGIIPAIEKARKDTQDKLLDQIKDWQNWRDNTVGVIQSVIDKLDELHKKQSAPPPSVPTAGASGGGAGGTGSGASGGGAGGQGMGLGAGLTRGRYGDDSISRAQWGSGLEKLYGVDTRDAACGPLALEGLLKATGTNPDLSAILGKSTQAGWWNTNDGMTSAANFVKMADAFGMSVQDVNSAQAIVDLERGIPVVMNTPKHYFLAQGYDPDTGLFDMGNTGLTVFNKRYMTLAEAQGFGGGAVRDYFEPVNGWAATSGSGTPSGDGLLWDGQSLSGGQAVTFATSPGNYSGPAPANSGPGDVEAYIRAAATLRHINPDIAVRVAASEGGFDTDRRGTFTTGSSWWPFQLHYGGANTPYADLGNVAGMGNDFTAKTGYKPGDPTAWEASIDYALDQALIQTWSQWYGAAAAGISNLAGLPGHALGGTIDRHTLLVDATSMQPYGQAGEQGMERIVPAGIGADPSLGLNQGATPQASAQPDAQSVTALKSITDQVGALNQAVENKFLDMRAGISSASVSAVASLTSVSTAATATDAALQAFADKNLAAWNSAQGVMHDGAAVWTATATGISSSFNTATAAVQAFADRSKSTWADVRAQLDSSSGVTSADLKLLDVALDATSASTAALGLAVDLTAKSILANVPGLDATAKSAALLKPALDLVTTSSTAVTTSINLVTTAAASLATAGFAVASKSASDLVAQFPALTLAVQSWIDKLNSIPAEKSTTITTNYVTHGSPSSGGGSSGGGGSGSGSSGPGGVNDQARQNAANAATAGGAGNQGYSTSGSSGSTVAGANSGDVSLSSGVGGASNQGYSSSGSSGSTIGGQSGLGDALPASGGIGNLDSYRLPQYAAGGIIDRPSLLVDVASLRPYAIAGERGIEHVTPVTAAAPSSGGTYNFNVNGPAMDQVSSQIRREFERSQWLHQGWR